MLDGTLIHPRILGALAAAGHGSTVLVADGNYPSATGGHPAAERVFLNLRRGLPTVPEVVAVLLTAVPVEAAAVMAPDDGEPPAVHREFGALLGPAVTVTAVSRSAFYAAARSPDLALIVATGDERHYANLLLTLGVRDGPGDRS